MTDIRPRRNAERAPGQNFPPATAGQHDPRASGYDPPLLLTSHLTSRQTTHE